MLLSPLWRVLNARDLTTGALIACGVFCVHILIIRPLYSPLRKVPGPGRGHLLLGQLWALQKAPSGEYQKKWTARYGSVVRFFGFFGSEYLLLSDPRAMHHVLNDVGGQEYGRSAMLRRMSRTMFGLNLFTSPIDAHKRQRRILGTAFTAPQVARLVPIFWDKASELAGLWKTQLHEETDKVIEVEEALLACTLDIIGKAGFGYDFQALEGKESVFGETFKGTVQAVGGGSLLGAITFMLPTAFPILARLPIAALKVPRDRQIKMQNQCWSIVDHKKKTDPDFLHRDLLAMILKANKGELSERALSDEEVEGQITGFLIAGHDTSATTSSMALFALANRPSSQSSLRKELQEAGIHASSEISLEQLNALPMLDAVVKETLRCYTPAHNVVRQAMQDNVLPLAHALPDGSQTLFVPRGTNISMPTAVLNTSTDLWGEDAEEFKPERWLSSDGISARLKEQSTQYALWSHLFSFGGGYKACIGFRFAIASIKTILARLIIDLDFSPGLAPNEEIVRLSYFVTKPLIRGREKEGSQMPLRIRRAV